MYRTVVLFKTHIWNANLEKFASKIFNETINNQIDFYILMHTDDGQLVNDISSEKLKKVTLIFSETDIKNIYQNGFYNMHFSNHWILMWFYQKYGSDYNFFWSIEYDVRISGNSAKIWMLDSMLDFLYVKGNYLNANNIYRNHFVGINLHPHQRYTGFLQLARYSKKSLEYLNSCFQNEGNGQDELIIYSLLNRGGFTGSNKFLRKMIKGHWTWENKYIRYNQRIYEEYESKPHDMVYIFHPIK